ncbi:hypothetical protein [Lysobacter gummosus]
MQQSGGDGIHRRIVAAGCAPRQAAAAETCAGACGRQPPCPARRINATAA